jgi:hypothetical protein
MSASLRADWCGRWPGATVCCIASGPSLTPEDCAHVRESRCPSIVTNTTFRMAPWADVLFGFDGKWWQQYLKEVAEVFKGARLTNSARGRQLGVQSLHDQPWFKHFHNSGASAISLAVESGASRVLLLGYDCQKTGGRTHWHGDHPPALGNAKSIGNWPTQFKNVARHAQERGTQVLNCSRATALTCFPRMALEEALPLPEVALP